MTGRRIRIPRLLRAVFQLERAKRRITRSNECEKQKKQATPAFKVMHFYADLFSLFASEDFALAAVFL